MNSHARVSRTIVGLELTVDHRGHAIRAIVTREALEALFNAVISGPEALLHIYRQHTREIEAAILERYALVKQEPVVLHRN